MRTSFLLRSTLLLVVLAGGTASPAQDDATLRATGKAYVDSLCSPVFSGRGYVSEGGKRAAEYVQRQFERLGLQQVNGNWFQSFTFDVNTFPDSCKVSIDGGVYVPGVDFLVDPSSGKADGRFDIVHLTPHDFEGPERRAMTMGVVTGKASMLDFPATADHDTLAMYEAYARELMHYGPVLERAAGKLTWSVASDALPYPMIEISKETWPDSAQVLDIHMKNKLIRQYRARNVLGMVPAKGGSKEWIILSAHYDHLGMMGPDAMFPGANDNASGVAMLLTLAEHFAKNPIKRNILFIAFAGEEIGLLGSEWCAVERPIDLSQVKLMVNMDILGTGDEGIMVVNATDQEKVYDAMVASNEKTGRLPAVKKRGPACNSDHCPFVKRGVPAIFIYTLGGIAAYHDVFDKPETLPLTEFPDIHRTIVDLVSGLK
jgi:hypothetical protein